MLRKLNMAQKIRAAASLIIVFLLVLATNMIDNHHFQTVRKSLKTVYEDRLVAKVYLYKINRQLQSKKHSWQLDNKEEIVSINKQANDSIQYYLEKFSETKLTYEEAKHLQSLSENLDELFKIETSIMTDGDPDVTQNVLQQYSLLYKNLDELSEIQLQEGKREILSSNRAIEASDLISNIEIGALIVIGFLIQLLIFIRPMK